MSDDVRKIIESIESIEKNKPNYHLALIDEMFQRVKHGENTTRIINELASEYSKSFDNTNESFMFAANALDKKAWELGLTKKLKSYNNLYEQSYSYDYDNYFDEDKSLIINNNEIDKASDILTDNSIPFSIDSDISNIFYFVENDINKAKELLEENEIEYEEQ